MLDRKNYPRRYVPEVLRPPGTPPDDGPPKFIVGVVDSGWPEIQPHGMSIGGLYGPFDTLEEALEVVPRPERRTTNKPIVIMVTEGRHDDDVLYVWRNYGWDFVAGE